jgi:choline dehydrogenase-like flavoprotein
MILDHLSTREHSWDVCIVGSGPIGMALALEFDRLGHDVVVLESGRIRVDPELAEASRAAIVDPQRHAQMEIAVCRALGGTSWTWGGRCVAFDEVDFAARAHVPHSGWPIGHDDIKPWYARASEYLLCGDDTFYSPPRRLRDLGSDVSVGFLERWSTESRLALVHRERIEHSERITLCLNSTVIDLDLGEDGREVERVVVAVPSGKSCVKARNVILAAGGIETTRLLLAAQRRWPDHFGGKGGPLGRYYMGHISGKIVDIVLDEPAAIADLDFELDTSGTYVRRRFMLNAAAQQAHGLLNTSFFLDNPPFHDPRHHCSVLSAVFLALALPAIGRRLVSEAIRISHVGPKPHRFGAHIHNVLLGARSGAWDILNILRDRFLTRPRKPGFLVRNRSGRYALHYHAEQEPNPDSRVVLTDEMDRFGLPRVAIDLRFTTGDAQSVIRSHQVLDSALRANAIGRLEYWYPQEQLPGRVLAQASDGLHQVGTTRMGQDPKNSVVDVNLKVHDVANLYVASSSVFPTTGQANSTYLATALAIRLAHHLSVEATGVNTRIGRTDDHATC